MNGNGGLIMIKCFTDLEFINWFPENKKYLSADVFFKLDYQYFYNKDKPHNAAGYKLLLYKEDRKYVGFLRYHIVNNCINIGYMAVEPQKQENGIGLALASYVFDEGIRMDCDKVGADYSNDAERLKEKLETKYQSQIKFSAVKKIESIKMKV